MGAASRLIALVLLSVSLASCSTAGGQNASRAPENSAAKGSEGSSFEHAVMMDEKTETAGIQAEHRWVQANFPGWHWEMQSVVDHGGHVYDVIEISRGGERREIYFDISNWFGHLS